MNKSSARFLGALLLGLTFGLLPAETAAQNLAGASFLKILPGARQQGMAGSFTGVTDDLYALFSNPGSAGFLREWQWSGNYTRWLAGTHNSSILFGRQWRSPFARDTKIALGLVYQGVPEFDSSDQLTSAASASDLLAVLGFGQRLHFLSSNLGLGANVKYLRSKLARFEAKSWLFDAGLTYRLAQFKLFSPESLFPFGSLSAGLAVNQLGEPLTFIASETPLPRSFQAGLSFTAGDYEGVRWHMTFDYQQIRDEAHSFNIGTEISWHPLVTLRAGYSTSRTLFQKLSFGLSVGLSQPQLPGTGRRFRANSAMRVDIGVLPGDDLFSDTYRGDLAYFPVGPGPFAFVAPADGRELLDDQATLQWETAEDPDLFDTVTYYVLVDTSRDVIARVLGRIDEAPRNFENIFAEATPELKSHVATTSLSLQHLRGGTYYWAVVATDRSAHTRVAKKQGREISSFRLPLPDLQITSVEFDYHPWITTDDYQGKITVRVTNSGDRSADNIRLQVRDEMGQLLTTKDADLPGVARMIDERDIASLASGDTLNFSFDWYTPISGEHKITALIDPEDRWPERREENNSLSRTFATIPKGTLSTAENVVGMIFSEITNDLPFVSDVCFDSSSATIKPNYVSEENALFPPLRVLAQRLQQHPEILVQIRGYIDPNSAEDDVGLADRRALAVRAALLQLGAAMDQIEILHGESLPPRRLPQKPEDRKWVLEERRTVKIATSDSAAALLFQPVRFNDVEPISVPVPFTSTVSAAVPLRRGVLRLAGSELQDTLQTTLSDAGYGLASLQQWEWPAPKLNNSQAWRDQKMTYTLAVVDSQGRKFRTPEARFTLTSKSLAREKKIAWPLEFGKTTPLFEFYWTNLFQHVSRMLENNRIRMRFIGHACAVGPEDVNLRLSDQRAKAFYERFIQYVELNYPASAARIKARIDPPVGLGETAPISMERINGEEIILGDNNSPIGRKINRSIEVRFYLPSGLSGLSSFSGR